MLTPGWIKDGKCSSGNLTCLLFSGSYGDLPLSVVFTMLAGAAGNQVGRNLEISLLPASRFPTLLFRAECVLTQDLEHHLRVIKRGPTYQEAELFP